MKKFLSLFLVAILLLGLVSCGSAKLEKYPENGIKSFSSFIEDKRIIYSNEHKTVYSPITYTTEIDGRRAMRTEQEKSALHTNFEKLNF